jgi:hypothetical protein
MTSWFRCCRLALEGAAGAGGVSKRRFLCVHGGGFRGSGIRRFACYRIRKTTVEFVYNRELYELSVKFILRVLLLVIPATLCAQEAGAPGASGSDIPPVADMKVFEIAAAFTTTLTTWTFAVLGGSILVILGTGYYRPAALWVRCAYLAFIPAWIFLSLSLYSGTRVQGVYVAAFFSRHPKVMDLKVALNGYAVDQIRWMEWGLACLGIWLLMYLSWWVFAKGAIQKELSK